MASRQRQGALIGTLAGMAMLLPATGGKAPAAAQQVAGTTYGNIRIENYRHLLGNVKKGEFEADGPGVVVRTLGTKLPTQFRLTADKVAGRQTQQNKKTYNTANLSGNIHYVITRHTEQGARTVTGTCGHAAYDERAGQIRLIGAVDAQLTDPATLTGPAILHADEAVVPASQNGDEDGVYVVSGSPDVNEITMTLRGQAGSAGTAPHRTVAGPIHLYHFRSGELQMGHRARVVGDGAVMEFTDTTNDTRGSLTANSLDVTFVRKPRPAGADGRARYRTTLGQATAEGGVRYRLARPTKSGEAQSVEGTSAAATYDGQTDQADLTGNAVATIIDPDTLLEPANVDAKSLLVRLLPADPEVNNGTRTYHFEIVGAPGHERLRFKPKPPPKPVKKPAARSGPEPAAASTAPRIAVGTVEITGFRSGFWDTGRSLEFTGPEVTFVSTDRETHTLNRLIGSRLTAEFAPETVPSQRDAVFSHAEASGNVRFHIEQPSELKDAQVIDGTATRIVYTNSKKAELLELDGAYTINLMSADGSPSTYTGTSSDRVAFDFTSGTLDLLNPDRGGSATVAVRTQAKDKTEKADKSTPPKHP